MEVVTVGYEKATLPEVIERLRRAGVERVADVRAVAASRRAGFSKTLLAATLAEAGIDYVHLRALGTPKAGRQAVRAGRIAEMEAIYDAHLETPEARAELARAEALVQEKKTALLCYEADPAHCHRLIVARRLCDKLGCTIENL
jgi:uncharacterized protein (DUF488 family)